ncbi:hypothetical protein JCM8202_001447 [Rhodotorula sphaerocarpa]
MLSLTLLALAVPALVRAGDYGGDNGGDYGCESSSLSLYPPEPELTRTFIPSKDGGKTGLVTVGTQKGAEANVGVSLKEVCYRNLYADASAFKVKYNKEVAVQDNKHANVFLFDGKLLDESSHEFYYEEFCYKQFKVKEHHSDVKKESLGVVARRDIGSGLGGIGGGIGAGVGTGIDSVGLGGGVGGFDSGNFLNGYSGGLDGGVGLSGVGSGVGLDSGLGLDGIGKSGLDGIGGGYDSLSTGGLGGIGGIDSVAGGVGGVGLGTVA